MGNNSTKSSKAVSIGNIKMYFNKHEFIPGEIVDGKVVLNLLQDTQCEFITLKFKATEQMIYNGYVHKPQSIIERIAYMIQINQKLPKGTHTFQFQYQLPNALQPSYFS